MAIYLLLLLEIWPTKKAPYLTHQIDKITELDATSYDIRTLNGMEHLNSLKNLEILDLYNNKISTIEQLNSLNNLMI
ncbi:hypothetical protein [Clostridium grantii]|uniref:hypothetical protein n=1 Tax=Clostridium grantii TaxID=40575 RepID=UPI000932DD7C|nr:hypothetical protein [Clostridium grantii]